MHEILNVVDNFHFITADVEWRQPLALVFPYLVKDLQI